MFPIAVPVDHPRVRLLLYNAETAEEKEGAELR